MFSLLFALTVDVVFNPNPSAGVPTLATFTPKSGGQVVTQLEEVHEKPYHLIVVSKDLSWFDHLHPEAGGGGTLRQPLTFPFGGDFILFSDFKPKGKKGEVVPHRQKVQGPLPDLFVIREDLGPRLQDGYEVVLVPPTQLMTNQPAELVYRLKKDGKDLTDVQPYLGAGGHNVIVSTDTKHFLHVHPAEHGHEGHHGGHTKQAAYGPEIRFQARFPQKGFFRSWLQFQHQNKVHTFAFTVNVKGLER